MRDCEQSAIIDILRNAGVVASCIKDRPRTIRLARAG